MKRVQVNYSGRVQGVEVVAEGPEDLLQAFLQKIESEMGPHIHEKEVRWEPAAGPFKSFGINY